MPSDLDIYRTGATLIAYHGDVALIEAARHEDAMMAKRELDPCGLAAARSSSGSCGHDEPVIFPFFNLADLSKMC